MKIGDLVYICPGEQAMGIYLSSDPKTDYLNTRPYVEIEGIIRSLVLFDDEIYSVPTFQLEVISETE